MSKRLYTIKLSDTDREYLQKISQSRTSQARTVDRSRILLQKENLLVPCFRLSILRQPLLKSRLCILKDHSSLSSISASCSEYPPSLLDPAGPVGP